MRFDELTVYFGRLESTSSRLQMYKVLGQLFNGAAVAETAAIAYLCEARLAPPFAGVEMAMGESMVVSTISAVTRKSESQVRRRYKQIGDLGLVVERWLPTRHRSNLTTVEVHRRLLEIARTGGKGSISKKVELLTELIDLSSPREARYIVRFTIGRLRLGVGANTIMEAVARTCPDAKLARNAIERAYNLCSDLGVVLKTMRVQGILGLRRFKVRVGSPVRMMMAERLRSAEAIIARLGRCSAESKLDGVRCQAHLSRGKVEIFSRNLERTTAMFPDLTAAIRSGVKARSAIIEGEAMAYDHKTGKFHPFQITVQRKRKHLVEEKAREIPLALILFDLLYANGRDYTSAPYEERRAMLEKLVKGGPHLRLIECAIVSSATQLERFFDQQVKRGMEGVVTKRLDAPYAAGARNFNWIKLKRAYRGQLSDTVDAVIVGYLRGRGARARLGVGALLAAVYDARNDTFQTIAKIGSGLSEDKWVKLRKLLDQCRVPEKPARVESRIEPDLWVEPKYVVTVLADEITRSPVHTCGRDVTGAGLALRFPRIVGFVRPDKSPEDATTAKEIEEMYRMQRH